ncbi:CDP-2,3-bis-(O-geranylgeranyl)-sn-glycerol synthase [Candidatus Micrarchaeota archaeon]|nr:CDP-2,3-bis-(O-geranylgeranyl)-sn-glycerol synthase [Candidatus Micrarchaeota archaeon]
MNLVQALLFILPAYIANATPVIFGGGMPVDFRRKFKDGERILGDGKTWRGLLAGLCFGSLTGLVEAQLYSSAMLQGVPGMNFLPLGFALSLGTMLGDLTGSFIKRRMRIKRGHPSLILDQLSFLLFALLFSVPFAPSGFFALDSLVFLVVLTYLLHVLTNIFANRLGLKKVPW